MGKSLTGKNLGKGIVQRKDGRYEARAMIDGKKIDIIDSDLERLRQKFDEVKASTQGYRVAQKSCTLSDWYEEWFETCKKPQLKNELSVSMYKRKGKNTYVKLLGVKKLTEITQIDVQNATNELFDSGYSLKTVREALGVMRECFDVAISNRLADFNPCVCITMVNDNVSQKERRVLDHWEQDLLLDVVDGRYYEIPYKILLSTGMRIGEFSALQWEDIDFVKKTIKISKTMSTGYLKGKKIMRITTPKTPNSYREIPFFGETEELLKRWQLIQRDCREKMEDRWRSDESLGNLVFTTTLGSPVTRYNIVHDINRVEKDMQIRERLDARSENRQERIIEHIHPHAFRHTFCTRCFEKGMDPIVVQRIMGHANYATTLTYTHLLTDKVEAEVQKVGTFL